MKNFTLCTLLAFIASVSIAHAQTDRDLTQYVDPFIGTEGGGNVFPGAALPYGVVKLGPDMDNNRSNSGYVSGGSINGFSHVHVSGTGGGSKYGNILVMPFTGDFERETITSPATNESASPGYYAADLTDYGIRAELTVTRQVGLHRYTFPASTNAHILIDAGHFLSKGAPYGEDQQLVGSEIHVLSDREVEGYSRVRGGWNKGGAYTVYFHAILDTPAESIATWQGSSLSPGVKWQPDNGNETGALLTIRTDRGDQIRMKVGISFISEGKARQNVQSEIEGWDFDKIRSEGANQWQAQLEKVDIGSAELAKKRMFYTAMYHTMLMPTDRSGENPKWRSDAPYYDDYYAIWDTFRSSNPFLTLVSPSREAAIVNSLIDIYKHDRYMPDARSGNDNGRTQGGSNAEVLIADAFVKGLDGIDYETAFEAMLKDAEQPAGGNQQKHGRGGLHDYKTLGYVSTDHERAGTRTLEYAYNDFCIALVAKGLGRDSLYRKYIERAGYWKNLWRPLEDDGATGFIWPRNKDGTWVNDFTTVEAGTWPDFFYESHSWEYSLYVPHDVAGLIEQSGGRQAFIDRLNTFFLKEPGNDDSIGNYYIVTNEPGFLSPTLYTWAGRPDLTNRRVRSIIKLYYSDERDGLPGNDDSGAMSSWLAFHMMGFFPVAGQDLYLITAPHLRRTLVHLENGATFVVEAEGLSSENRFVTSATLNGEPLNRAWFRHTEIKNGGRLILNMGSSPGEWGTDTPPPSMSD
ncbi:MAG: GH92 family glycosyl hydrolase [Balneolaceae bacterium]|nr:GH92 family glycosyl hydrolase [Balneolaceae bacterium]